MCDYMPHNNPSFVEKHETQLNNLEKNQEILLYALGEKSRTNGDRDDRIKELGKVTEREDKNLFEHIIDIKEELNNKADKEDIITRLDDKVDKKDNAPPWLIKTCTIFFTVFIIGLFYLVFMEQVGRPLLGL